MANKDFEAGMVAGVKPIGKKLDQLSQRIEKVRSEQEEVKEKISILSDDLETRDKLRQLGLENYHDLTELDESEKVILMSLLYWLAEHKAPSDSQREYLSCLGRCIGALGRKEGISPIDVLQNISDTDIHKVFLRVVLEYIYLNTQIWTFDESEQDIIEAFEVGRRTLESIKRGVEGEFLILGDKGVAQKYDIREIPKEDEQTKSVMVEETELEETVDPDVNMADNEETVSPFHQLISMIQRYAVTEKLGKPLLMTLAETDKNKLIAKVLPTILPVSKTVVEITKLKNGHLVFTTNAMYWAANKDVKKVPYSEIKPGYLGTKPTEAGVAFVYTPKGNDPMEIMDSSLGAEFLERLLSEINRVGEYAETDVLTDFQDLPQEVQLAYMRFVSNVVRESGHSIHEVYRLAVQYGLNEHWDYINTEFEMPFEDEFRAYSEEIPYPNEEALAISMLKDICTIYQYTKDSEVLSVPEKKYFPLIFNDTATKRDQIIRYAQMEKQIIESRIDLKTVQDVTDAFNIAAGAVGASAIAYLGVMGLFMSTLWLNILPGVGLGSLISAAVVGRSVASSKNEKQFLEVEMRQKARDKVMQSYTEAEEAANRQGIPEFFDMLQQEEIKIATRIGIQRTAYTQGEKAILSLIQMKITNYFNRFLEYRSKRENEATCVSLKLARNLSTEECDIVLSFLTVSGVKANRNEIVGIYDGTYSEKISENFIGMLFMRDCIYHRKRESVYAQRMSYLNMLKIEKKWTAINLQGRNGDVLILDKSFPFLSLLQEIVGIANQNT